MLPSQAVRNEQMAPILYPLKPGESLVFERPNADAVWADMVNTGETQGWVWVAQRSHRNAEWRKTEFQVIVPVGARRFVRLDRIATGTGEQVKLEAEAANVRVGVFHAAGTVRGLGFDDPMNSEWMVAL